MDGKSALVPLRRSSTAENIMPPEMIALPGELGAPLPDNVSALTPNAQARARLGEIADSESVCLRGASCTAFSASLPMESSTTANTLQPQAANSFFVQWGMPPVKRGMSLFDTRESAVVSASQHHQNLLHAELDDTSLSHDSPSFLDSVLA